MFGLWPRPQTFGGKEVWNIMAWPPCGYMHPLERGLWGSRPWRESALRVMQQALFKEISFMIVALLLYYMYYSLVWCVLFTVCVFFISSIYSSCLVLGLQMYGSFSVYTNFVDGTNRYTWNISSIAWVIFSLMDELLSSRGIYLGPATNNIAKYSAVIKLLLEAISFGIHHLIVNLDLQLVVS